MRFRKAKLLSPAIRIVTDGLAFKNFGFRVAIALLAFVHSLQSDQRLLSSASLSRDPLADIWIAIHQGDVSRFAPGQKTDAVFARQRHILEVENYAATFRLGGNECFQVGNMLFVQPAAEPKDHFRVR